MKEYCIFYRSMEGIKVFMGVVYADAITEYCGVLHAERNGKIVLSIVEQYGGMEEIECNTPER